MAYHLDVDVPVSLNPVTNFEKVIEFNKCFGVQVADTVQKNICMENPNLTRLRLGLILEEVKELRNAHTNNDFVEIVDAMADILYVVYGMGASYGVPLDKAFDIVHKSNMSKLCTTEQEAIDTVQWYHDQYSRGLCPYDSPEYRKGDYKNQQFWVVYNANTGKILKNINYKAANFQSLLE